MRIAIASGKGGAGKTSVTASLARIWPVPHILCDTDVEAPNLHIYLHPRLNGEEPVSIVVPEKADQELCTACGLCRQICGYGAIARFGKRIAVFPDMCHGCGGCFDVCPAGALVEGKRALGGVSLGSLGDGTPYLTGATRIGEVMTPPLIRALLSRLADVERDYRGGRDVLLDSPPGVSCPVMTVVSRADAVLMVVDPSPFGRSDFALAYDAFSRTGRKHACILNRAGQSESGDAAVRAFCREHALPLLADIPFSERSAAVLSRGELPFEADAAWEGIFRDAAGKMRDLFSGECHD